MGKSTAAALMIALAMLGACGKKDAATAGNSVALDAKQRAYQKEILDWRAQRLQRLQKPDGWLSLVGMHWLENGVTTRIGSGADNGTRLAVGPVRMGILSVNRAGTVVHYEPQADAGITIDGLPADKPVDLISDADPNAEPTVVGFNKGDASFIVIKRGDRFALRVRDALAPTRTGFTGIDYFDIDPGFRFVAKFAPHPPGSKIKIVNILGLEEPMDNPGTVTFEKDGKSYTLDAIDEGDHTLFLVFADRTSGHETYAASRFLYAPYPGPDGTTVVDFNKAYNPPCAFTSYSTCPLPPTQNRLDLAVTAGEKQARKPGTPLAPVGTQ
jgi:uncharacterized protein (DUF1684 family)